MSLERGSFRVAAWPLRAFGAHRGAGSTVRPLRPFGAHRGGGATRGLWTGAVAPGRPPGAAGRGQPLRALEHLALGLDRGGDDQLGLLELADTGRAHGPHASPDGAHEVERAVLREGGPVEDLLERAGDADADARAARQIRVRSRHAPVIAAARGLL